MGIPVALLAPNAFLAGLALIVYSIVRRRASAAIAIALTAVFTALAGLNTRLPSVIADALAPAEMAVTGAFTGAVGQPLRVDTNAKELWGRRFPYASVAPACYGDGCFITRGFRGPYTGISRDYWRENVVDTVLAAGFSRPKEGEKAPRILVDGARDGDVLTLRLEMSDESGAILGRYRASFRSGYPLETADEDESWNRNSPLGLLQYLLHGNSVAYWSSRWTRPPVYEPPLKSFLAATAKLSHPQDRQAGNATPVTVEILEEKVYEPVWIIVKHDDGKVKWSTLSYDKARHDHCGKLIRLEKPGTPLMQGWFLFNGDPTGRKKARYTGNVLCEGDSLWFFDYASERGKMILTKYTAAGDLAYRVSFDKPKPIEGYAGHIMSPTLREEAGYLYFDWWNTNQSGADRHIRRAMKVRLATPAS